MNFNRINRIEITFNDKVMAHSFVFDCYENIIDMFINDHECKISPDRLVTLFAYDMSGNRARGKAKIVSCENGKLIAELTEDFVELPDRRRSLKLPAAPPIPASLVVQNEYFPTQIKDISLTGIFVYFSEPLVIGHKCRIIIDSMNIDAEIRIVRQQGDNSGYGCEFVELSHKHEDSIAQYLFQRQLEEREIMRRRKGIQ